MLDFDDIKVEFESQGFRCSHLGVGPERGKAVRWFFRFYFAKEQFKAILIFFGILPLHSAVSPSYYGITDEKLLYFSTNHAIV